MAEGRVEASQNCCRVDAQERFYWVYCISERQNTEASTITQYRHMGLLPMVSLIAAWGTDTTSEICNNVPTASFLADFRQPIWCFRQPIVEHLHLVQLYKATVPGQPSCTTGVNPVWIPAPDSCYNLSISCRWTQKIHLILSVAGIMSQK